MLWLLAPVSCSVYRHLGRVAGHAGRYYARFTACCHGCSTSAIDGEEDMDLHKYLYCSELTWP